MNDEVFKPAGMILLPLALFGLGLFMGSISTASEVIHGKVTVANDLYICKPVIVNNGEK